MDVQQAFSEFSPAELDVGYNYAIDKCRCRLDYASLKTISNHAGAIRKAKGCVPRVAATEAIRAYERRNRTTINADRFQAYVRSTAKMLSDRSPARVAKRNRDERAAELAAVG